MKDSVIPRYAIAKSITLFDASTHIHTGGDVTIAATVGWKVDSSHEAKKLYACIVAPQILEIEMEILAISQSGEGLLYQTVYISYNGRFMVEWNREKVPDNLPFWEKEQK